MLNSKNHLSNVDKLWENPNPNAYSFDATTIAFDASAYDAVIVIAKQHSSGDTTLSTVVPKGYSGRIEYTNLEGYMGAENDSLEHGSRQFKLTDTGLEVSNHYRVFRRYQDHLYRTYEQNNFITPLAVYGVKLGGRKAKKRSLLSIFKKKEGEERC